MTSFSDNKKFGGTDVRVVTDTHKENFKTLNLHSPSTSGESKDMEVTMIADSPTTTLTDTPLSPPTGHWDIGDTIRYGDKTWMVLGKDNEWHEHEGPGEFSSEDPGSEKIEFFRQQEYWSGYGEKFIVSKCWFGYHRWTESALDATFEKYKLDSKDAAKVRKLDLSMAPGDEPKRSLQQFAVLLKFMEILEISSNARNLMQDPAFSPADARFFAKYGFETVLDPEAFDWRKMRLC